VAQFLCCIPLAGIGALLTWLKPAVPQEEQDQLLAQVTLPKKFASQLIEVMDAFHVLLAALVVPLCYHCVFQCLKRATFYPLGLGGGGGLPSPSKAEEEEEQFLA